MKYGLLTYFGSRYCNFGDYVQSIAIENLLVNDIGVSEDDIVYLTEDQLKTYQGEDLIFPYSYVLSFLMDATIGVAKLSDKLHIVFLGASVEFATLYNAYALDNFFNKEKGYIELFRKYAPVGCRDNSTKELLEKNGIGAYLQGCITNTLPRRKEGNYSKIFLIDVPVAVKNAIPKELLDRVEVMTNADDIGDRSYEENYRRIKERYNYYRDNAALIISSRYHVVTPCNAMGIPCIFVKRAIDKHIKDIRLDTLHPNIQIAEEDDFSNIDFFRNNVLLEEDVKIKESIKTLAISRINAEKVLCENVRNISSYFDSRIQWYKNMPEGKNTFSTRLCQFIRSNYCDANGNYYIWGAIKLLCDGEDVIIEKLVKKENPNLKFVGWIDSFKKGNLANRPIFSPGEIALKNNDFIIIVAETALDAACKWMKEKGYDAGKLLVLVNKMLTQDDINQMRSKA